MKKTLALLLTLILTFGCFGVLGMGTVSAEETEPKTKHYSDIQTNLTFNSCINRLKTCNIFRQYTQSATSKNTTNTSSMLRKYKSKVCLGQTISNINVKNERKNKSSIKRKHLIKLNKKMKLNLGMIGAVPLLSVREEPLQRWLAMFQMSSR